MRLETFFEKFELFADAPNAVGKMRELILESAIRGTLVPHNANDEPASQLLKRVETLRSSSVQAGKVRKQTVLPPVGDDAYLQIPPGWEWTRLGNTGRIFNGDSVSESGKAELARIEDGLPFIATKDVGYGRDALVYDNGLKVSLGDPRFKVARAKAVLICAEGGSAGRKIGITDRDICFGNKLFANEVWEGIHHRYIFYAYQAPAFFREFAARMTGIIGGIARSEFLLLPIPLPPEEEQKRIVAKVDELMALCDRLDAQQQERDTRHAALARASLARFAESPTPANLDFLFHQSYPITPTDLRKTILSLAVDGTLAKLCRNETPTSEVRLGEVVNLLGGYAFKSEWFTKSPGIRLVRNQNISHGELDWRDTEYLPNERADEFAKWALRPGDLVLSLNRPFISTGLKLAWVTDADCPCLLVQRIVCLRPDPERLLANYLFLWCNAPHFYRDAHVVPSSGVPYIAPNRVAQMRMRLPPLDEQRSIVAKVDQLMALVDRLETRLDASRATAEKLMEAVVSELVGNGEGCEHPEEVERRVTQGIKVSAV